ncbi:DUF6884 domain-containing protein [Halocatena pleomorpha]|uniref:DUF6884 domain-containing protein n=1 Tax=Halocatena pleomorpha TaxID=1785090 RepID=UPI0026BE4405
MTLEIGLVSCVKTKQDSPAIPRDLYASSSYQKMRLYAEKEHDEWWILSAKHGLLDPNGPPIDRTMRRGQELQKSVTGQRWCTKKR